mmetsp:Transcript_45383/g.150482  ORF Transcript_45383/g.150482 Transcript_45383/m.150482 type:complete len:216 (+) Transcript_45383:2210-2857(+)
MVEDEALDEARVGARLVLHVHDLDHVQVERRVRLADRQHRVHADGGKHVRQLAVHLSAERALRNLEEQVAVGAVLGERGPVDVLEQRRLRQLDPLAQQPRVHPVREVALCLLHHLADDEDGGGGAVAGDVVLRGGDARNHARGRVLDLHLVQQRVPVLGELDVARAADKHLERALGTEVALEHVLQAAGRVDVHQRRLARLEHIGVRVELLGGRH